MTTEMVWMIVNCETWSQGTGCGLMGRGVAYPDVSEVHTMSVYAVLAYCLRDVCDYGDDE